MSQPRGTWNRRSPSALVKYILIPTLYALIASLFVINIFIFSHQTPHAETTGKPRQLGAVSQLLRPNQQQQQQQNQQLQHMVLEKTDGTFNGAPISLRTTDTPPHSTSHCVGDNFQKDAWKFRSCHYSFLCFNTTAKEYVIFQSKEEQELVKAFANMTKAKTGNPLFHSSSTLSQAVSRGGGGRTKDGGETLIRPQSVSIGGINYRWRVKGVRKLEWSPTIVNVHDTDTPFSYYELPPSAVMIPFHSLSGRNPGHLSKCACVAVRRLLLIYTEIVSLVLKIYTSI
jgi:hypothetical protein